MKVFTVSCLASLIMTVSATAFAEMKQITCIAKGNSDTWASEYPLCSKDGFNSEHSFLVDTKDFAKDEPRAEYSTYNCKGDSTPLTRVPLEVSATTLSFLVRPSMLKFESTAPNAYMHVDRATLTMNWGRRAFAECSIGDIKVKNQI